MDYGKLFRRGWEIVWQNKYLSSSAFWPHWVVVAEAIPAVILITTYPAVTISLPMR